MKVNLFVILCLILIPFFSGCKTTQLIQPGQQAIEPINGQEGAIRGFAVLPETWINEDPEIMQKNLIRVVEKVGEANYNSVFFKVSGKAETYLPPLITEWRNGKPEYRALGFDPLRVITEAAHKYNLKIYALIELSDYIGEYIASSIPQVITGTKKKVRNLIANYDIDGLSLVPGDNSPDIIEDLVVDAMLVKPYLVNSFVYSGVNGYQNAVKCLKEGIVDFIIPKTDFDITDPEKIPNHFVDKINFPDKLKKITPEQVIGLDLSALFPDKPGGQTVYINKRSKTRITDSAGHIGFITSHPDTIELETMGGSIILLTESWTVPYRYALLPDNKVVRKSPWVEFRIMPEKYTDLPVFDLLCKTEYPALVWINNDSVKLYKTGIFFNKITFKEGPNRVRATVLTQDSLSAFYESEFIYHATDKTRKPYPLWINERTIEPASDLELLPEDVVRVSFQGALGQEAYVEVNPGRMRIKCSREDHEDYSLYMGEIPLRRLKTGKQCKIILKLIPSAGAPDNRTCEVALKHTIIVREADDFPYVKIAKENSRLTYNLGAPRLGGPIRAELGPGVVMKTNGKSGENYRIRLSRTENGFINQNDVQLMPAETVQPSFYISSMSCGPSKDADILTIPYLEPVPYEVYPEPDQRRIVITLFGVETSSTWITHLAGRRIIDKVTWQQPNPETYQVYVNLKTPDIWGYDIHPEGKRLVLAHKISTSI